MEAKSSAYEYVPIDGSSCTWWSIPRGSGSSLVSTLERTNGIVNGVRAGTLTGLTLEVVMGTIHLDPELRYMENKSNVV